MALFSDFGKASAQCKSVEKLIDRLRSCSDEHIARVERSEDNYGYKNTFWFLRSAVARAKNKVQKKQRTNEEVSQSISDFLLI